VTFQFGAEFCQMLMIPGFNRAKDIDRRNIRTGKRAIMDDLFDARAARGDLCRQIGQPTRSIANDGSESAESAIRNQTAFDYATQHVGIDVAAAQQKDYSLACEVFQFPGKTRGERRRGSAFNHALLQLNQTQDGESYLLFRNGNRLIDKRTRDLKRV
jgi:hypothetical protein